jgi:hypothetical protein
MKLRGFNMLIESRIKYGIWFLENVFKISKEDLETSYINKTGI